MEKYFNTQGACRQSEHYMVNLDGRVAQIRNLIDRKKYFSINRGRQYGKTTTLFALEKLLKNDYITASLDFQFFTRKTFQDEASFAKAFAKKFIMSIQGMPLPSIDGIKKCADNENCSLEALFESLSDFCATAKKPVVLIIDEADNAADSPAFHDFLALLRGYYIHRDRYPTFQSVILASVYDIRRLKAKFRPDSMCAKNSPWNIAVDFDVDMDLHEAGILDMLQEYENDHHTGMDGKSMAAMLYEYTSGYPYLVSRLCQLITEKVTEIPAFADPAKAWTKEGFLEAEKILLSEQNPLFESLVNKLTDYPKIRKLIHSMLFTGYQPTYNPDQDLIGSAFLFGFVKNADGILQVANRIFEMRLYNLFLSEEEIADSVFPNSAIEKNQFIQNGMLNMELLLEKFTVHWNDLYRHADEKFIEDNGRKFFLLYLKPIINGIGNYYIESRTRDNGRTDVIVDYRGRQYIIEIKIWHGEEYHQRGEKQLADYLEAYHAKKGYLLSFNFNKKKVVGVKEITCADKVIFEAVV